MVGVQTITVIDLKYIEILQKLIKLTSSIVSDPWCNMDAAGGKRDAHAGFFCKKYQKKPPNVCNAWCVN